MAWRLRSGASIALVAGALLLAACGSGPAKSGAPSGGASSSTGTSITISNFMFSPMSLTVSPGSTVQVTNKNSATHTLTATGGQFNTGNITQNQTKTFKAPTTPGAYHYICNIHQYMVGTITVK
jgi:plastocyanin